MSKPRITMYATTLLTAVYLCGCVGPPAPSPAPRPRPTVRKPEPPPPPPPPPKAPTATANVKEVSRVTDGAAPEFWPRTSPNGERILFTTFDKTKVKSSDKLTGRDLTEGFSIVMMKLGEPGRQLVAGPYADQATWYPDGTKFVYCYWKMTKPLFVRTPVGGIGMTFVSSKPLGDSDGQPDISPDGKKVAFHTQLGGSVSICTVDAGGGNFTVFVEGASPRWSPDGTRIAFDRPVGETSDCFILDLSGGQVTQVTTDSADDGFPVWSPDGKWIAFTSDRDGKQHLFIMKADGTQVTQLTRGETSENHPHWSADGCIYFTCDAGAPRPTTKGQSWHLRFSNIWRVKPALPEE